MTFLQQGITVLLLISATMATRFLPFLVFDKLQTTPQLIVYLSKVLPGSALAMLVVYCLRDISFVSGNHALPESIAIGAAVIIHLYKRNTLLSIAVSTGIYMVLVQTMLH